MSDPTFSAPVDNQQQTQPPVTKVDSTTDAQPASSFSTQTNSIETPQLNVILPQPPTAPVSDIRDAPEPVPASEVVSEPSTTAVPSAPSADVANSLSTPAAATTTTEASPAPASAVSNAQDVATPSVPEAAATLTQIANEPVVNGIQDSQVNGVTSTPVVQEPAPTPAESEQPTFAAPAPAPASTSVEPSPAPTPAAQVEAPVVPPAPIAAPEKVPPPPVVPLPQQLAQRPALPHVDSASSLAAQPPTPTVQQPSAASSVAAAPASDANAAASLSAQSAPASTLPSPASAPAVPSPAESAPPVAPPPVPEAPAPTTAAESVHASAGREVKMEDATAGDVSPTAVLKRSAPEETNPAIDQSLGAGHDERDVKRPRVDSEPSTSFAPAPEPVQGFDPMAFSAPQSLPPSAYSSAAPVSAPTMSPSELHHISGPPAPSHINPALASSGTPVPQQAPATPIAVMTRDQQKSAVNLLRNLKRNRNAGPFLRPVDPVAQLIPDYPRVITKPMDLGTVENKVNATGKAMTAATKAGRVFGLDYTNGQGAWEGASDKVYRTADELKADLAQIWTNCFTYNGPPERHPVSKMAQEMKEACEKGLAAMPAAPLVDPSAPPPRVQQDPKRDRRPSQSFLPTIRRSEDGARPKREIRTPAFDLAYSNDALEGVQMPLGGKSRTGRVSGKSAQEQLRFCKEVVKELFKKVHEPYAFPFYEPVNYIALNIPQYPSIIKKPMDLGTIRTKLDNGLYPLPPYSSFESDIRLMFRNCYTFNPPGTPVNDMGHRLEAVFDAKWDERPSGTGFEDDYSDDDGINAMQAQLANLQASIEQMKQNKKLEKERQRAAERAAAAAYQRPPKPPKRTSMDYGAPRPPSAPAANRRPKKPKKKREESSDEDFYDDGNDYYGMAAHHGHHAANLGAPIPAQPEETGELVTFEMKRELANKIVTFDGENLERAIDIIRQGMPALLGDANKEIELDIDQLDQGTLLTLYRFVCPDSAAAQPKQPKARRNGSAPGPSKRKNLDEVKESERIEMLEARLREFEKQSSANAATPGAAGGVEMGGAGIQSQGAVAGGEQASSDSSSDDGSDSDSDDD